MKTNGMLGRTAFVTSLSGGNAYSMSEPTMPMSIATPTATGRLRNRAAMTAANAAAIRSV